MNFTPLTSKDSSFASCTSITSVKSFSLSTSSSNLYILNNRLLNSVKSSNFDKAIFSITVLTLDSSRDTVHSDISLAPSLSSALLSSVISNGANIYSFLS